jgi:hypothetical protein
LLCSNMCRSTKKVSQHERRQGHMFIALVVTGKAYMKHRLESPSFPLVPT